MKIYELTNKNDMKVTVTNVGCAIMKIEIPTKVGLRDVVLGFDTPEEYCGKHPFFGVVVGRFANRIGGGKFEMGGKTVTLEKNDNGVNHLHGGSDGFDKKIWTVEEFTSAKIVFMLNSPDGDSGYPGDLTVRVTYTLSAENVLRIDYEAETKTETICNLTNHSYFNLCGHDGNVYGHELQIFADKITAVDGELIPTGGLLTLRVRLSIFASQRKSA